MKKIVILMLIIVILITSCQRTSFIDNLKKVNELDEKYNGSWMKEKLNGTVIPMQDIPRFIADLEKLKSEASRSNDIDKNASLYLIRARIDMLQAEEAWQISNIINAKRKIKEAVWCNEADIVKSNSEYLGKAVAEAINASVQLDDLIARYPEYRDIVGYNENKSLFYLSPTCYFGHYARVQLEALRDICYNNSANATSRTIVELSRPLCITP